MTGGFEDLDLLIFKVLGAKANCTIGLTKNQRYEMGWQGLCKVQRESIPSSRSCVLSSSKGATEAYRGVRLRRRILSKPAPLDTASTAFQPLGMLALNVSSDFARALSRYMTHANSQVGLVWAHKAGI